MQRFNYVLSLFFVFGIPDVCSWLYIKNHVDLDALTPFVLLITIIGSIWDLWATRHGIKDRVWLWNFNHNDTLGIRIFDLPIEEYFFYVASSMYVVFMWESFKLILDGNESAYPVVGALTIWTLCAVTIPFLLERKKH